MKAKLVLKNFLIFLVAPVLALGLFFLTRDLTGLTASVLDISEIKKIEQNQWCIAYKTEKQCFELFGSSYAQKAQNLDFEIIYDPNRVAIRMYELSGGNVVITHYSTGSLGFQLHDLQLLTTQEGRFQLPFSGDGQHILLAEASLQTEEALLPCSIGNLNVHAEHSLLSSF